MSEENDDSSESGEETQISQAIELNSQSQISQGSIEVTPKKNPLRHKKQAISPDIKRYRTPKKCKDCNKEFTNSMLWMIHSFSKCKGKSATIAADFPIVSDFTTIHNHKDSNIQIVGFVLAVHTPIETGERKYMLRATLADINGQRCYFSWFLDIGLPGNIFRFQRTF